MVFWSAMITNHGTPSPTNLVNLGSFLHSPQAWAQDVGSSKILDCKILMLLVSPAVTQDLSLSELLHVHWLRAALPVPPSGNSEYLTVGISLYSGFRDPLKTTFMKGLLRARNCTLIIMVHNAMLKKTFQTLVLLSSLYRLWDDCSERLSNLPKVTQTVSGWTRLGTQVLWL